MCFYVLLCLAWLTSTSEKNATRPIRLQIHLLPGQVVLMRECLACNITQLATAGTEFMSGMDNGYLAGGLTPAAIHNFMSYIYTSTQGRCTAKAAHKDVALLRQHTRTLHCYNSTKDVAQLQQHTRTLHCSNSTQGRCTATTAQRTLHCYNSTQGRCTAKAAQRTLHCYNSTQGRCTATTIPAYAPCTSTLGTMFTQITHTHTHTHTHTYTHTHARAHTHTRTHTHTADTHTNTYTCTQGTHNMYQDPKVFRPERFLPDGEYDKFSEAERLYKFVPFIQVCVYVCMCVCV